MYHNVRVTAQQQTLYTTMKQMKDNLPRAPPGPRAEQGYFEAVCLSSAAMLVLTHNATDILLTELWSCDPLHSTLK